MAKIKMKCLFSGNLCKNCSLYRARHYYLCFRNDYQGYKNKTGEADTVVHPAQLPSRNNKFETPNIKPINIIDHTT